MIDTWNQIVEKTAKAFSVAGFRKAVIGLSGGIDSAVTACIAVEALGCKNVLGVSLPSDVTSKESCKDAMVLASILEVPFIERSIKGAYVALYEQVSQDLYIVDKIDMTWHKPAGMTKAAKGNICARIRMVTLMAFCNQYDALLLNTCNKSEDMVGYCTLYGDSCGAVAPIGDLYKTEVYVLAKWINENTPYHIPNNIIRKEPTAELWTGQLDSDEIPEYKILDPVLMNYLDRGLSADETIAETGVDPDVFRTIINMYHASQFKRDQSTPVIKVDK